MNGFGFVSQESVSRSENWVTEHAQYQDSYQAACDWLKLMQDRLQMCADFSGDKHSIGKKLERVQVGLVQNI